MLDPRECEKQEGMCCSDLQVGGQRGIKIWDKSGGYMKKDEVLGF